MQKASKTAKLYNNLVKIQEILTKTKAPKQNFLFLGQKTKTTIAQLITAKAGKIYTSNQTKQKAFILTKQEKNINTKAKPKATTPGVARWGKWQRN